MGFPYAFPLHRFFMGVKVMVLKKCERMVGLALVDN